MANKRALMTAVPMIVVSLLFCTPFVFPGTAPNMINHEEEGGIGAYTVLISPSEFKKEILMKLAAQFLHDNAHLSVLDVGIFINREAANDFAGAGVFDYSYGNWLMEFEARRKRSLPLCAEVLKCGNSSALRIRYSDGRLEEVAIHGGEVFHPAINGARLDLLHVKCVRQGFGAKARLTPLLYFRVSKDIDANEGGVIARSILRSSGATRMSISMRPDNWFMFDPYYPWVNPFAPVDSPPTKAAERAWQLLCDPAEERACFQVHRDTNGQQP